MGSKDKTSIWEGDILQWIKCCTCKIVMQAGVCVTLLFCGVVTCLGYEAVNSTQIKIENNSGQRDYHEQEGGKVLPFRRQDNRYSKVQQHREQKIKELWRTVDG